jgi:hypothetical protein
LEFEKIYGIEDFVLGSNIDDFENKYGLLKVKEVGYDEQFYEKYVLKIQGGTSEKSLMIEYLLTFHENLLVAYEFEVDVGTETQVYADLINKVLAENKNVDFIDGDNLRYWYSNKGDASCHKYIRLIRSAKGHQIKGGITNNS